MGGKVDVRGNISWKSASVVAWTVQDFFSLPENPWYEMESPSFSFMGGTWYLYCCLNGKSIFTKLKRVHSSSNHHITFRIGIKAVSGLEIYHNITQSFLSDGFAWGVSLYLNRATLLKKKSLFVPQGTITFICTLPSASNNCQQSKAKQSGGKDVATETTEEDFRNLAEEPNDGEEISSNLEGTDELSQSFKNLLLSGEHCDTIVKVKNQEFRTHRLVLIVRSRVFASMFRHDTIERQTEVITIEDCDPDAFREFLSFLYSAKLENVSAENVANIYYIADKYQVDEVKYKCVNFMMRNMSVDNFCDFITVALIHSERVLLEKATEYFVVNAKKISVTVKWLSFHRTYPVESNELHIKALMRLDPE